jgi:glycosidase
MGVDIFWFMPIFPISKAKRKGSLGSYYAVADFRATNPQFGTMDDFQHIIREAHALGMKVILDWVPNHTGWDHHWIRKYHRSH